MKLHKPIHLSALRSPTYKHKVACPLIDDIRASYWRDLGIECYSKLVPIKLSNKRLRKWAFVGFTWAAFIPSFAPVSTHTVYADPIAAQTLNQIKPLPLLKEPPTVPQNALELVFVSKLQPFGTYANNFAPLNCTAGVASRLPVTWTGNANEWDNAAAAAGYAVGGVPKVEAIAVSETDSYFGHVGIVLSVNPDGSFVVWEENYNGLGVTDERTATTAEFQSFIYL